jgi:hypothetical protein
MNRSRILRIAGLLLTLLLVGSLFAFASVVHAFALDTCLSNADASFWGEDANDYSRCSVASAGDVNGDGGDDFLIGAYGDEDSSTNAGQTYLLLGSPPEYDLTISSTAGGNVTEPGEGIFTYDQGTVVSLNATPNTGYEFVNWSGDVTAVGNSNSPATTITMSGNYSITANFELIPPEQFTLTISSTAGGSVTTPGEGAFTYDEGTVVNLVATPNNGCRFARWSGDGAVMEDDEDAITTITMSGDSSITANFECPGANGCFIATAAYGTPMAQEVQTLRSFRDNYLLTNPLGRALVNLYYGISPSIADFIAEHPSLKPIVRVGLVPAVAMSVVAVNTAPAEKVAILTFLVLVSLAMALWVILRRHRDAGAR